MKPVAKIKGYSAGRLPTEWVMLAPVEAAGKLWKRAGTNGDSFDLHDLG